MVDTTYQTHPHVFELFSRAVKFIPEWEYCYLDDDLIDEPNILGVVREADGEVLSRYNTPEDLVKDLTMQVLSHIKEAADFIELLQGVKTNDSE
jgi:hypothetical protein